MRNERRFRWPEGEFKFNPPPEESPLPNEYPRPNPEKYNRVRNPEIDATILIGIPSRNKPNDLKKCIEQLIDASDDRNNYDLLFIIDDDQIDDYKEVVGVLNPDIVKYIKPSKDSWTNIQIACDEQFSKKDYYFFMPYGDDISGLSHGWDTQIIYKKNHFKDDVFMLYTKTIFYGRTPKFHERCYYVNGKCYAWTHGETMPIITKKLFEFVRPAFKNVERYKGLKELVYLTIIHLLYRWHKENRNVCCEISFDYTENDGTSLKMFEEVWEPFLSEIFEELRPTVEKIKNYIDKN